VSSPKTRCASRHRCTLRDLYKSVLAQTCRCEGQSSDTIPQAFYVRSHVMLHASVQSVVRMRMVSLEYLSSYRTCKTCADIVSHTSWQYPHSRATLHLNRAWWMLAWRLEPFHHAELLPKKDILQPECPDFSYNMPSGGSALWFCKFLTRCSQSVH
jgi:hypothetical protein